MRFDRVPELRQWTSSPPLIPTIQRSSAVLRNLKAELESLISVKINFHGAKSSQTEISSLPIER